MSRSFGCLTGLLFDWLLFFENSIGGTYLSAFLLSRPLIQTTITFSQAHFYFFYRNISKMLNLFYRDLHSRAPTSMFFAEVSVKVAEIQQIICQKSANKRHFCRDIGFYFTGHTDVHIFVELQKVFENRILRCAPTNSSVAQNALPGHHLPQCCHQVKRPGSFRSATLLFTQK